jgi:putative membrane protein
MALIARLVINAVAIWLAVHWVHGLHLATDGQDSTAGQVLVVLGIAVVFTVVNALVKPIVKLLSLPVVVLTLGLFILVVNGLMLELTARITETSDYGLRIDHFWPSAIWGAVIISVVNWVLHIFVPDRDRRKNRDRRAARRQNYDRREYDPRH